MKPNTRHIEYFIVPYILLFIVILAALFQYPKSELHLLMNSNHTLFGDWFFRIWTEIGGGTVPFIIIGLLLLYRYSLAIYLLSSQLAGGILSVVLKRAFNEPRPLLYFKEFYPGISLPTVQGVDMYTIHSFPSGHTITAFALFFGLSLFVKNKWLKLLFFVIAALVGYSRIYLSEHFAIDVLGGSVIGILSARLLYPFLVRLDKNWKQHSLSEVLFKKNQHKIAGN